MNLGNRSQLIPFWSLVDVTVSELTLHHSHKVLRLSRKTLCYSDFDIVTHQCISNNWQLIPLDTIEYIYYNTQLPSVCLQKEVIELIKDPLQAEICIQPENVIIIRFLHDFFAVLLISFHFTIVSSLFFREYSNLSILRYILRLIYCIYYAKLEWFSQSVLI